MMEYKGYTAHVEVDFDANIIFGRVEGIEDVITFQGYTPEEAARSFHDTIDDYLKLCKELGRAPEEPRRIAA